MLDNLFSPVLGNLQSALSKASQRQTMLMTNIANVNVPGYKRSDMDFHVALQGATHDIDEQQIEMADARAQRASDFTSQRMDGNNVDMEREVASISETELRFQALTDLTSSYFSGLKNVIREGK